MTSVVLTTLNRFFKKWQFIWCWHYSKESRKLHSKQCNHQWEYDSVMESPPPPNIGTSTEWMLLVFEWQLICTVPIKHPTVCCLSSEKPLYVQARNSIIGVIKYWEPFNWLSENHFFKMISSFNHIWAYFKILKYFLATRIILWNFSHFQNLISLNINFTKHLWIFGKYYFKIKKNNKKLSGYMIMWIYCIIYVSFS